jgi:hypothetical protein
MEVQDGLPRAAHQAARLAVRDGHVGADEVECELDDHADPAKRAALEIRGTDLGHRIDLKFAHAQLPALNGGFERCIPA